MASIFDYLNEEQKIAFQAFIKLMQRQTITEPEKALVAHFIFDCLHDPELKKQLQLALQQSDPKSLGAQELVSVVDLKHWARAYTNYESAVAQLSDPNTELVDQVAAMGALRDLAQLKPFLTKLDRLGILAHHSGLEKIYHDANKSQEVIFNIEINTKLNKANFPVDAHYQLPTARAQVINYFKQLSQVLSHAPLQIRGPK